LKEKFCLDLTQSELTAWCEERGVPKYRASQIFGWLSSGCVTTDEMTNVPKNVRSMLEEDFIFGMITNSSSVGGIKNITGTDVDLQDGLFEVTLVRAPKNPADLNLIITGLMNRAHSVDGLYSFKTGKITFESEAGVPWTLDGEFGGEEKEITIENLEKAFEIAVK